MAKIILTAENFAFGPISKLLFIADLLHKKAHTLIFVGYGTSLQLAKKFPFDEIYEVDTDAKTSKNTLEKYIKDADLLVSSMDIPSIVIANKLHIPTVWIDCLFWFWQDIPKETFDVSAYIRELTIDDSKNALAFGDKIKNLYTVGPIIGEAKSLQREKQALISFGGGEASYWYKVGKDTNYPFVMTSLLENYVDWSHFDKVILASSEHIIQQLKNKYSDSIFEFTCLSQENFLEELSRSEILLTTAGLVTTESAFQQETPVVFLPSSNNSHYQLVEALKKINLAPAAVRTSDFLPEITLEDLPPQESINIVMKQLKEFENAPDIQKKVGQRINFFMKDRDQWSRQQVIDSKLYIDSLGSKGVETVANIIENLLENNN